MSDWQSELQSVPNDQTNASRILHGSAIGRDDVRVDVFDGHWVVQTRNRKFPNEFRGITPELAKSVWWKKLDIESKGPPEWVEGEKPEGSFTVLEHGVKYLIDFSAGYSQGLFLDQRLNREELRRRIAPGDRILNTFAYTCSFSVVTVLAGGVATSMDLSGHYLNWGKENFKLNDMNPADHYFCKGDVMDWLKRFSKSGRRFKGIILDPPTFSRNGKKVWRVEQDYAELVRLAVGVLDEEGGWLLCSTNHNTLSSWEFESMLSEGVGLARRKLLNIKEAGMPPEFEGDDYLKSFWLDIS